MKRIRFASCLMVLFLLVLNLEIALGQEQSGIDAIPQDFADHSIGAENADGGYVVNLEVDGGFLALTIPADYQYQPVELTEIERYPFTYTFTNEKTKTSFLVQSSLHTQKDQNHLLKKLYERSNKFIVVSDGFLIGEHTYLIYTKEQATYDSDSLKAKQTLSLTPEEKKLSEKINHLLIKHDYIGSIYVKKNKRSQRRKYD